MYRAVDYRFGAVSLTLVRRARDLEGVEWTLELVGWNGTVLGLRLAANFARAFGVMFCELITSSPGGSV